MSIPIEKFALHADRKESKRIFMDPRCFASHFNAIAAMTQSTHVIVQQLRHQLNDVTEMLRHDDAMRAFKEQSHCRNGRFPPTD